MQFLSFFVENDDAPISDRHQALDGAPLPPSIRVETKKSIHAYWPIEGECFEADARRCNADIIIVDTLTAAFGIENENDNAEGSRITKKLTGLAQRLNCVILFLHHIGKAKQEDGRTVEAVHRGRGASSYSGFSHAIFNLIADPLSRETAANKRDNPKSSRIALASEYPSA